MCTLIAFHRVFERAPIVVATNRDERYERPAQPPSWRGGPRRFLAPVDAQAGGTWMGVNEAGLWIGLTNRDAAPHDAARRSRGRLCLDLLAVADARAAIEHIRTTDERYNGFNLLAMDGREALLVEYEEGSVDTRPLAPGVHIVTNRSFAGVETEPKVARARALLHRSGLTASAGASGRPADLTDRLLAILGDHGAHGLDALCLHGGQYGTRSAAVWVVAEEADRNGSVTLSYTDGPPCSSAPQMAEGELSFR